ncbi:hypothetical protein, partial [Planotetraspora thailandica]|uniref:hypothetical protein n=1 Tax=Planotetraspora thailandica TaxID=487172 RepID=UPI00194E3FBB
PVHPGRLRGALTPVRYGPGRTGGWGQTYFEAAPGDIGLRPVHSGTAKPYRTDPGIAGVPGS